MPDIADVPHVWFVPVTGGRGYSAGAMDPFRKVPIEPFNVQWEFARYPTTASFTPAVQANAITTTTMGSQVGPTESKLLQCYGSWSWLSCADASTVTVGGQLAVGTVFANLLRLDNESGDPSSYDYWEDVEVWAKYRVSDKDRLDNIFLSIGDMSGNSVKSVDDQQYASDNTWKIVYMTHDDFDEWDAENLRVVLSFQGTTDRTKIGSVTVDVEWFAIRLNDEREERP